MRKVKIAVSGLVFIIAAVLLIPALMAMVPGVVLAMIGLMLRPAQPKQAGPGLLAGLASKLVQRQ